MLVESLSKADSSLQAKQQLLRKTYRVPVLWQTGEHIEYLSGSESDSSSRIGCNANTYYHLYFFWLWNAMSAYEDCSGESKDEIMQYEDSVSQPNAIDNATLQEQLYSSSLLRLWRSGACTQIYEAEEDDEYFDETLLEVQDGEYALSKDLAVFFWTEFREYYGYTSLREVFSGSFIIVNDHLHDELKQFSKNVSSYTNASYNMVKSNELIRFG
ncbi:hypothetical protein EMCRGX_G003655 [Ephydatia muelleri]